MKLGKLFTAVVKTAILPVAVGADVLTMGARKACGDKLYSEELVEKIANDLDEVTN